MSASSHDVVPDLVRPVTDARDDRARSRFVDSLKQFLFAPKHPRSLALLRIGVCLVGLAQLVVLRPHLSLLYGNYGFVQWAIYETGSEEWLPSIGKACLALQPWNVTSGGCLDLVFAAYAVALVGLLVGFATRFVALAAWVTHTLTVNSGFSTIYGVDTMLHICLFYFLLMPVGQALSVDALRRPAKPSAGVRLGLRVLQIHLCFIYLDAGISKLRGVQWWNGEAMWRALMSTDFARYDFSWLAQFPALSMALGWSVVVIEIGYVIAIWNRRSRLPWLAAIVAMHVGIAVLMGLWLFSAIMIVMNLCAFADRRA